MKKLIAKTTVFLLLGISLINTSGNIFSDNNSHTQTTANHNSTLDNNIDLSSYGESNDKHTLY